ncbi:hypothetical protein BDR06DRAFT_950902 [Suillus hirtellus]|nr:hypothetical protein BDR06DRAFT_950902 [Suillus hirtellus]
MVYNLVVNYSQLLRQPNRTCVPVINQMLICHLMTPTFVSRRRQVVYSVELILIPTLSTCG